VIWLFRHPKPIGAEGRCVGSRSDLAVDARKAKRLAHRIRRLARSEQLPREVLSSPLRRCAEVGRWLRRWGFRLRLDPRLRELDFGNWDGRRWAEIPQSEIDAWVADFAAYRPGGGESLHDLLARLQRPGCALVITHGGVINALRLGRAPSAAEWPPAPGYGRCIGIP
jgi:alpha-ribazole phosphatase